MDYPPITVGVVTHNRSFVNFDNFLTELNPALREYPGHCQLVVVNNSGEDASVDTKAALLRSSIGEHSDYIVVASPENNIAVGRNTVFEYANNELVAFIDDDEFPSPAWLTHLATTHHRNNCAVVAGPAHPLFLFDTPDWIRQLDLHNATGKKTDDKIENCPTANVLIDRTRVIGELFNHHYGVTGGEDTEFFLRQYDANVDMRWCNEAAVYEYIPQAKSTSRYMIKRCILQGALNRRILSLRGDIPSQTVFVARSMCVFSLSIFIGIALLISKQKQSGKWLKRAFGNLGHCFFLRAKLYPHA